MKKVVIALVVLLLVAAFVIHGKAFAEEDAKDYQESVKASESTESTETTIPYSAPYDSSDTGADEVEVDEDV